MKLPTIAWESSGLPVAHIQSSADATALCDEIARMSDSATKLYQTPYASLTLPIDDAPLRICRQLAKTHSRASLLVVVGIGGSNLGTQAVAEAILGKLHNFSPPSKLPRVLWADTVDPRSMTSIASHVRMTLRAKKHVVINVISKSGTTTETVANLEILLSAIKAEKKTPKNHVVVTTDEGSALWDLAHREGFSRLSIPKLVGGRYSVFSCVGLFPLTLLGIDTKALLSGAGHMRAQCLNLSLKENSAAIRAMILVAQLRLGKNIADNFYFASDLEALGKWYRQLMGESIGKEWNSDHSVRVECGITPTVSIGSTDLHSMAQLYFGGPADKLFTICTVDSWPKGASVPRMPAYDALVPHLQGKSLVDVMTAISEGTMTTLANRNRPFCHIRLPALNAYSIGALLQMHMMEMMLLGRLLNVNPFDQPNVEEYKIATRKILAKKPLAKREMVVHQ